MTIHLSKLPLYLRLRGLLADIDYNTDPYCEKVSFYLENEGKITDEELELLCKIISKLPNLKEINLTRNHLNDDQLFKIFQVFPLTLESVNLSYNDFSDDGFRFILQQVHRFKRLRCLFIWACNVQQDHFNELDFHPSLRYFHPLLNETLPIQTLLRTKINNYHEVVRRYRKKIRKFIWLVAKKKIDEFLLIEVFHKLK